MYGHDWDKSCRLVILNNERRLVHLASTGHNTLFLRLVKSSLSVRMYEVLQIWYPLNYLDMHRSTYSREKNSKIGRESEGITSCKLLYT